MGPRSRGDIAASCVQIQPGSPSIDIWVDMRANAHPEESNDLNNKANKFPSAPNYGTIGCARRDPEAGWRHWSSLQLDIAASEVRDHLSNERTFLSTLKLSLLMSILGTASLLDFRLPESISRTPADGQDPSQFWSMTYLSYWFFFLAVANLLGGTITYFHTQAKYIRQHAFVKEHWSARPLAIFIGLSIITLCFFLFEEDSG